MSMRYQKTCVWCRKHFIANRKDHILCSNDCKFKRFRIMKDMILIDELVPEKKIKEKYYTAQPEECILYIQWFSVKKDNIKEKYGDVYAYKNGWSLDFFKRFKKKEILHGKLVPKL